MKRFIISFVALFTVLNINSQKINIKFHISEPKVISQVRIPFQGYWPDGKFCFLPEEDSDGWVCYWGEGDTFRTKARTTLLEDHISSNSWQIVMGRDVNKIEGFNDGGSWMIGIRRLRSGKLVGFFHAESWWSNDGTAFKSIGVTYSSDNGLTWEPGKRILAPSYPKPQEPAWVGLGDGCVVWNANRQQYICYYQEVEAGGICMAASSDPDGAPGTWKKWDGEDFTLDGCDQETQIGGRPVLIEGLKSVCGSSPSVMWNDYLQKWMMVYTKWGGDIYLSLSIDGIDWSVPTLILAEPIKPLYPNLVSEDGDFVGEKKVRLYYSKDQQENGIRQLAYREIEFYENIDFADANVKAICVANWDTNGDGELSDTEAMSVTDLGVVFKGNTNITSFDELRYFTGLTKIANNAFQGCTRLTSISIPSNVETIGDASFEGSGLTNITLPNNITTIGSWACQGCENIEAITLPESVTYIGGAAFAYSPKLTSINLPSQLGEINEWMFTNCFALKSINIPENVITINKRCFYGSGLTSITIPNSVTSIGESAFEGCSYLKDIYCYPGNVPETSSSAFNNVIISNVLLHVPYLQASKYKKHDVWKQFKLGSYIDAVSFTYSVDGLSKIKMDVIPIEQNLEISAEEGWKVVALTVNGENKMSNLKDDVLTVYPVEDTEVKVIFGWADESSLYTEDATGIATIEGEGVNVQTKDGQIWVEGAAGKTIRLYTIGGALMTTVTPQAGKTGKFSVATGTYIVQIGSKAAKVVVK